MVYYSNIFGWYEFDKTYNKAVDRFDNCYFCEIGCFQGKSACGLTERIKECKKNIKVVCVDIWPNEKELNLFQDKGVGQGLEREINLSLGQPIMEVFIDHINAANVRDIIFPIRCNSSQAAQIFPNKYFKFIYIDAGHTYEQVTADLVAWYPKLAEGGLIAGHDYGSTRQDEVFAAVNDFLQDKQGSLKSEEGNSWEFQT